MSDYSLGTWTRPATGETRVYVNHPWMQDGAKIWLIEWDGVLGIQLPRKIRYRGAANDFPEAEYAPAGTAADDVALATAKTALNELFEKSPKTLQWTDLLAMTGEPRNGGHAGTIEGLISAVDVLAQSVRLLSQKADRIERALRLHMDTHNPLGPGLRSPVIDVLDGKTLDDLKEDYDF